MPRPKNPLVAALVQSGFSRREAFRIAKLRTSPVAWWLYTNERISSTEGCRLIREYPDPGDQAVLALHVDAGWALSEAERAYFNVISDALREVAIGHPELWDDEREEEHCQKTAEKMNAVDLMVIRTGGLFPRPTTGQGQKGANRAIWHDSEDPAPAMADAVAEIQRLRSKLHDLGVDPDS